MALKSSRFARALRGAIAALAITSAAEAEPNAPPAPSCPAGHFVDAQRECRDFSASYQNWFGPRRYPPQYRRAALENGSMLLFELAVYWFDPQTNIVDWQFPNPGEKLTSAEAFRFDDNLLRTNYLFHSSAGATHYLLSRVNGFGVLGSFGVAAGSSLLYETVLEWRELVSINDLIVTPIGGTAAGEFFHQLSNYLNSEPPHVRTEVAASLPVFVRDAARVTLGAPRAIHDAVDEPVAPASLGRDNLGLSAAYWHRFRLLAGRDALASEHSELTAMWSLRAQAQLVAMPGFLRPGRFSRWFRDGNFTSFDLRLAAGERAHEAELSFDSHLVGYYAQNMARRSGHIEGSAQELAFGAGLDFVDRRLFGIPDQYGIVHVVRPSERVWLNVAGLRLRLAADLSPDFASLHSFAYERYRERFGSDGVKSSLLRHGYWHGLGFSAGVAAAVAFGAAEFGVNGRYGRYESIEGAERFQEDVTRETHGVERIGQLGAHLAIEPPRSALSARCELTRIRRKSSLEPVADVTHETQRFTVALGVAF